MEIYPSPRSDVTAEEILTRLIERAPILFFKDKDIALTWARRELSIIQQPEQLILFREKV